MTATAIDLMRFCYAEECRGMEKPNRVGDVVYATDTKVLIEVPPELWNGEVLEDNKRFPKAAELLNKDFCRVVDWQPFPAIPDCDKCGSAGEITVPCVDCIGSGGCVCNCGHEHECCTCKGSGTQVDWCEDCIATFGNRKVFRRVFGRVAALPGVVWGAASKKKNDILFFKFDGGRGAFMPRKQED